MRRTIPLMVQIHSGAGSPTYETGTVKLCPTLILMGFRESLSIILGFTGIKVDNKWAASRQNQQNDCTPNEDSD